MVRPPAVAGTFYPDGPDQLAAAVDTLLDRAPGPSRDVHADRLAALIVPHAAYRYSGRFAAAAYVLLREVAPRPVLLLGPAHWHAVRGLAGTSVAGFATPLGVVATSRPPTVPADDQA